MTAEKITSGSDDQGAKKKLGIGFWLCVFWLTIMACVALFIPFLPLKSPTSNFVDATQGRPPYAPSWTHWFGTDKDARDVFSRTLHGARISLTVGFTAITAGFVVGGTIGVISGYFRGWLDRISSFVFVVLLSFPSLVLAILLTSLIERSLLTVSLVLGLLSIAPVGRLARAATMQYADREFVLAARQIGSKDHQIILKEILPNVAIPMSSLALLGMAVAVVAEGGLAFLGLSVEKGITWGGLIQLGSDSSRTLEDAPWISFFPILMLFLTVLSLNFAGDRLRAFFDVKEAAL
ncbi:MAG: ABC transporter permease [Actinomycetota bacterium]|nr:ABC transporter permease [Actinomycetota bacterium]MDA3001323.1 ABC transporter permease [Actinomycetota bacterium]